MLGSTNKKLRSAGALIALLLTSCFAGYFYCELVANPDMQYYPYAWRAHWITAPFKSANACFRKRLLLSEVPRSAYLAVAADNFFEIEVNGEHAKPFFAPSRYATWITEQSVYTEIGYPRRGSVAWIFDIKPLLHPGLNAIAIRVQSDQGAPQLAVQGQVSGINQIPILSDANWRCWPRSASKEDLNWDQPGFLDASWPAALDSGRAADDAVDGDPAVLTSPVAGMFVRSPDAEVAPVFHRKLHVDSGVQNGWIRISSFCSYDLSVNGRLLYSNALLNRYDGYPWAKRGNTDSIARIEGATHLTDQYPTNALKRRIDMVLLKNVFQAGDNDLAITLHDGPVPEARNAKTFWLQGMVESAGKYAPIVSDSSWTAGSGGQTHALPGPYAAPSNLEYSFAHFAGKYDPGLAFPKTVAFYDATIFLVLGLFSLAFALLAKGRGILLARLPLLLPAIVLVTGYALQVMFANSTQNRFFVTPQYSFYVLEAAAIAAGVAILAALLDQFRAVRAAFEREAPIGWWPRVRPWVSWAILACILGIGLAICVHGLAQDKLLADEYVSLLAARGILRHGVPIYENTGIFYTRSSLFHYLLAGVMAVFGEQNIGALKMVPVLWHLAAAALVFIWGRQLKGEKAGLLAAMLAALSPFAIYFAREIRFYSQFEFFITLTFYFLWRALQKPESDGYKVATLLAYSGAYLSQQFAFALLPALFLVALFSGQLRAWFRGWPLAAVAFAIAVMALDAAAYFLYCQTYLPFVDAESVSLLGFHADVLEVLPMMLLSGLERAQLAIGAAYLLGALCMLIGLVRSASLRQRATKGGWTWWAYLYLVGLTTILITALLASRPTPRYIVHLVPIVCLTAACGVDWFASMLGRAVAAFGGRLSAAMVRFAFAAGCVLLLVAAGRPVRTWDTTKRVEVRDLTDAIAFLKRHAQPTDKLVILSPEAAMYEFDRCDYMWRPKKGSVFKYVASNGQMRERNSGAVVLDNADKLRALMANSERIWILAQTQNLEEKGRSPSGELSMFVADNFKAAYEPLGITIMVWDRASGHYRNSMNDFGNDRAGF